MCSKFLAAACIVASPPENYGFLHLFLPPTQYHDIDCKGPQRSSNSLPQKGPPQQATPGIVTVGRKLVKIA